MRTSFHHQSEAQPPNGRLTAATSPDTPSAAPASQSVSNASHMTVAQKPRGTARFAPGRQGRVPRAAVSCAPSATRLPTNARRPKPSRSRRVPTGCRRTRAFYSLTEEKNQRDTSKVESCGKGEVLDAAGSRGELASLLDTVYPFGQLLSLREGHADLIGQRSASISVPRGARDRRAGGCVADGMTPLSTCQRWKIGDAECV
jgi:hypothetical protein